MDMQFQFTSSKTVCFVALSFESQPRCRSVHLLFYSQAGPFFSPFSDTRVVGKVNFTVPRDFHHTDRHTNLNYRIHRLEWRNKGPSNHISDCDLYTRMWNRRFDLLHRQHRIRKFLNIKLVADINLIRYKRHKYLQNSL